MKPPRAQRPIWATLLAAALALIVYQAEHAGARPPLAVGPQPARPPASTSAPPTPPATGTPSAAPASHPAASQQPAQPGSARTSTAAVSASAPPSTRPSVMPSPTPPAPPPPSPTPSPQPPAVAVSLAVTPPRPLAPLSVRAALVVPTGPPDPPVFPRLTAAVDLLGLHAAIALP